MRARDSKASILAVAALAVACGETETLTDTTVISGRLTDQSTGGALSGRVTVTPELGSVRTSTPSGAFRFEGAQFGTRYRLVGEATGYLEAEASVVPSVERAPTVDLALQPAIACRAGERRCARGGLEGVELCAADGRGFELRPCGTGQVCVEGSEVACIGAPTVTLTVEGSGSVLSVPSGLLCNPTCERSFSAGTQLMLEARAFGDADFESWGGACSGSASTCMVTVDRDLDISARFQTTAYRLSVETRGGDGRIVSSPQGLDCGPTCQAFFAAGDMVTLTAEPGADRVFQRWEQDCSGTSPTCTVTMSRARRARARFQRPGVVLSVRRQGTGTGVVTSTPNGIDCGNECEAGFNANTEVALTPTPAAGSRFDGWGGACTGTDVPCQVRMSEAREVIARFEGETAEVAVTLEGGGAGNVSSTPAGIDCGTSCSSRFPVGEALRLDAAPGPRATFFGWGGNCAAAGTNPRCEITPTARRQLTARFEPFYLAPLDRDGDCQLALGFDAPDPLALGCGAMVTPTAPGWMTRPGRSGPLGTGYEPGTGPLDLGFLGVASLPATVELSVRREGEGVVYSDHDRLDQARRGLEVRTAADGQVIATTYDGAGGASSATTAAGALPAGAWTHLAVTLTTNELTIHVDGSIAAREMGTVRFAASSSTALIGAARTGTVGATTPLGGFAVDELRLSRGARY